MREPDVTPALTDKDREAGKILTKPFEYPPEFQAWIEEKIRLSLLASNVSGLNTKLAFVGELRLTAAALTLTGEQVVSNTTGDWLVCNGTAVSRTTYKALFDEIGTAYGTGDGSTTFNLPDYRGQIPVGQATAGTFATRGATVGAETTTIAQANLPSVSFTVSGTPTLSGSPGLSGAPGLGTIGIDGSNPASHDHGAGSLTAPAGTIVAGANIASGAVYTWSDVAITGSTASRSLSVTGAPSIGTLAATIGTLTAGAGTLTAASGGSGTSISRVQAGQVCGGILIRF